MTTVKEPLWTQALVKDIRLGDARDDQDLPLDAVDWSRTHQTLGVAAMQQLFDTYKDSCRSILEIGVNDLGFTNIWLSSKRDACVYVGIDLEDRSHYDSATVHTIQASSSNVEENLAKIHALGLREFDLIYIDGWHSINQVLTDWEYTQLLAPGGIVGFHDTNHHPGPKLFVAALDPDVWAVEHLCQDPLDFGVTVATRLLKHK